MRCSLEREFQIPQEEVILAPMEDPQEVVEQKVETTTQVEPSREGRKRTREAETLVHDARENVGAPSNKHRHIRSPNWYTSYMSLMTKLVESGPSPFKEEVEKHVRVDSIVEEYESFFKNNLWKVVPRLTNKSIVGLRWIFMVKHAIEESIEKYKAKFFSKGYSQVEGIKYAETFEPVARYSSIRSVLALAT